MLLPDTLAAKSSVVVLRDSITFCFYSEERKKKGAVKQKKK